MRHTHPIEGQTLRLLRDLARLVVDSIGDRPDMAARSANEMLGMLNEILAESDAELRRADLARLGYVEQPCSRCGGADRVMPTWEHQGTTYTSLCITCRRAVVKGVEQGQAEAAAKLQRGVNRCAQDGCPDRGKFYDQHAMTSLQLPGRHGVDRRNGRA